MEAVGSGYDSESAVLSCSPTLSEPTPQPEYAIEQHTVEPTPLSTTSVSSMSGKKKNKKGKTKVQSSVESPLRYPE